MGECRGEVVRERLDRDPRCGRHQRHGECADLLPLGPVASQDALGEGAEHRLEDLRDGGEKCAPVSLKTNSDKPAETGPTQRMDRLCCVVNGRGPRAFYSNPCEQD